MKNSGDVFPNRSGAATGYLPHYDKQKAQYVLMREKIIKYMSAENFTKLTAFIGVFDADNIASFFREEGGSILDYALSMDNVRPFAFLCETIPIKILQHSIAKNNYYLVKAFLIGEAIGEDYGRMVAEARPTRLEKLLLLLKIDETGGIQTFIKENFSEDYMTHSIKEDFQTVLERPEQRKRPTKLPV